METRFRMLSTSDPEGARRLYGEAQHDADVRWQLYEYMAARRPAGA